LDWPDKTKQAERGARLLTGKCAVIRLFRIVRAEIGERQDDRRAGGDRCCSLTPLQAEVAHIMAVVRNKLADMDVRLEDMARQFNPTFPRTFPRFVQYAIWRYCSQGGLDD
jgi:hypothetical protein